VEKYNAEIADNPKIEMIHLSREEKADAEAWAKKAKLPWPTMMAKDVNRSELNKYAGRGIPHYVLVDKDGKVLSQGAPYVLDEAVKWASGRAKEQKKEK